MMKTARKTKMLALLLTVLMVVLSLPVLSIPAAAASIILPEVALGETVYDPDLTQGVPAGWMAVPKGQVPWYVNGGGAWTDTSATTNTALDTSKFSASADGLKVSLSGGDFALVFPELKDGAGNEVVNYVYTMEVSGVAAAGNGWSFGPITDVDGSAAYVGGSHLMVYASKNASTSSHRFYGINNKNRVGDNIIERGKEDSVVFADNDIMTISVYHLGGMNYYVVNDKVVCAQESRSFYGDAALNGIGINFCSTNGLVIRDIKVQVAAIKGLTDALSVPGATIRYANADGTLTGEKSHGLRFGITMDKTSDFYQDLIPDGTYDAANANVKFGALILPADLMPESGLLKIDTPKVVDSVFDKVASQDADSLNFYVSLFGIPEADQDRSFVIRPYVKEKVGDTWEYSYAKESLTRSYAGVANIFYEDTADQEIRARLDAIFANCGIYFGSNTKRMKFTLLADFHYKQGMYMSSIADMQAILDRAHDSASDFIIHAGDFCNDYIGSPELLEAYLSNNYSLPAYGVYGNHELESGGNSMQVVTPLLNNSEVVWGTEDGKIGDGSIAYFYFEVNGFRIVCTDTNYSWNNTKQIWEHNYTCSYGWPSGNSKGNSLGPVQLEWLEEVLTDAAEKKIPCIVMSHESFSGIWSAGGDAAEVREIMNAANAKQPGTVLMAINGHLHTNHAQIKDGILYFDMNTVRNGSWRGSQESHYTTETFEYVEYDSDGKEVGRSQKTLDSLSMGKQTWFFADPLSAVVTISSSGRIVIEGMESEWINGVVANNLGDGEEPKVVSGTFDVPLY